VFYLITTDRGWIAKVEGKKYFITELNELERASEALARILSYGNPADIAATSTEVPAEEAPAEEAPAEEAPAEETPEETPGETT
jgi:hypothetical protein